MLLEKLSDGRVCPDLRSGFARLDPASMEAMEVWDLDRETDSCAGTLAYT